MSKTPQPGHVGHSAPAFRDLETSLTASGATWGMGMKMEVGKPCAGPPVMQTFK